MSMIIPPNCYSHYTIFLGAFQIEKTFFLLPGQVFFVRGGADARARCAWGVCVFGGGVGDFFVGRVKNFFCIFSGINESIRRGRWGAAGRVRNGALSSYRRRAVSS